MPIQENISREFASEFLFQLKKAYFIRKEEKEKPEEEKEESEDIKFIRPLTRITPKIVPIKQIVEEKKKEIEAEENPLDSIKELMKDPVTNTIVCYGADEKIMIKRGNRVVETPYFFKEEEIKDIIKQIAKESNAPLGKVVKAGYKDFAMSAIMSDFIGSKFVLVKKQQVMY